MLIQTAQKRELLASALKTLILGVFAFTLVLTLLIVRNPGVTDAATANTVNFQARLQNATGSIVPDGTYNVEFKLFDALSSSGSSQGSCTGDIHCLWTETRTGGVKVTVANGYLTVNLGSVNAFPTTINWDQDLYLSLNIGGTASPSWDGEMNPRLKLTAVPYAFSAGQLAQFNSVTGYTSTLSIVQPTGGNQIFQLPDMGAGGTYTLLTGGTVVQLQGSSPGTAQTGHFNITGTGIAGTLQAGTFDAASVGALNIATSNADTVNIATNAVAHGINIANGAAVQTVTVGSTNSTSSLLLQAGTGNLQIQTQGGTLGIGNNAVAQSLTIGNTTGATAVTIQAGTGSINLQTQGTGNINIATNAVAQTVTIGNGTGASSVVVNSGTGGVSIASNGIANTIQVGNTSGAVTQTINIGTNSTVGSTNNVSIGSTAGGTTTIQSSGILQTTSGSLAAVKSTANAASIFQIQDAAGNAVISGNTDGTSSIMLGHTGSGTVGRIGTAVAGTYYAGSSTVRSFGFTKSVASGHTLIGSLTVGYTTTAPTLGITDSKGNTYTVDASVASGNTAATYIFSSSITSALATSDTITLTLNSGAQRWAMDVEEFDNVQASPLDKTATNAGGSSTSLTSTSTATTTQANELIFGAFGYAAGGGRVFSPGTNFTNSSQQVTNAGSNERADSNEWRFTTTTGAKSATASLNTASIYAGLVATYKVSAPDTTAIGSIGFNDGGGNIVTIQAQSGTSGYVLALPTTAGSTGQCLQAQDNSGTLAWNTCGAGSSGVSLQLTTPGTADTGNFNVSGTGIASTAIYSPQFDVASAGTLSLGTTNATTINIGTNAAVHTIAIGNGAAAQTVTVGSTNTTSTTTIQAGSGGVALTGAVTGSSTINAVTGFKFNGTSGSTTTCSSGDVLQNMVLQGGIITAGSCVANGGGATTTLQDAYNNSATTDPQIQLSGTNGGLKLRDAASTVGNIFQIQNSAGSSTYFAVTNAGVLTNTLDVVSGTTLSIGTTTAATINIGNNAASHSIAIGSATGLGGTTIRSGTSGLNVLSSGALNLQSGGATGNVSIDASGGGDVFLGASSTANISIGSSSTSSLVVGPQTAGTIQIASSHGSGSTTIGGLGSSSLNIRAGTGGLSVGDGAVANLVNIGNSSGAVAQTVTIGTNATAGSSTTITIGSTIGSSSTTVQAGSGGIALTGAVVGSSTIDSVSGFKFNGTSGSTTTCSSGNVLQNAVIQGGIITAGTCVANGGGIAPTLQDTYNNSGTTDPQIQLGNTNGGFKIRDAASTVGTIFQVQDSAGSTTYLGVSNAGITTTTANATSGFKFNGTAGSTTTCSSGDVLQNAVLQGGIITGGSCVANGGVGGGSATLQTAYNLSSTTDPQIQLSNTNGGLKIRDASSSTITNLLQLQDSAGTTTYFAATTTGLQANALDRVTAGTLNLGTSTATDIQVGSSGMSGVTTIFGGTALTLRATTLNLGNATATTVNVGTASGATVNIGATTSAASINIGSASGSVASISIGDSTSGVQTITIGTGSSVAKTVTIGSTNGTSSVELKSGASGSILIGNNNGPTITIGNTSSGVPQTINLGNTTFNPNTVTIGSTVSSSTTTIQGGTGNINLQTNSSSAGVLVKSSANSTTAFQVKNSGNNAIFSVDTSGSSLTIGDATNYVVFLAGTYEPELHGSARHSRQLTLSPEYPGAVMTGDGSSNIGTMTSDNMTTTPFRNYYKWVTTQGSAQDYDIWVKVALPSDWAGWPSGQTICLDTFASATTANGIKLNALYDTSNTAVTLGTSDLTPTSTSTWQNKCTSSITTGTYAANGIITLDFKLTAPATTGDIRIGDLTLSYLSKW